MGSFNLPYLRKWPYSACPFFLFIAFLVLSLQAAITGGPGGGLVHTACYNFLKLGTHGHIFEDVICCKVTYSITSLQYKLTSSASLLCFNGEIFQELWCSAYQYHVASYWHYLHFSQMICDFCFVCLEAYLSTWNKTQLVFWMRTYVVLNGCTLLTFVIISYLHNEIQILINVRLPLK